jgi:TPR repeat protein
MRFTKHPTKLFATTLLAGLALVAIITMLASQASGVANGDEIDWLSQLARSGDAGAQLQLGLAYLNGRYGITPDPVTGRYWLSAAAQNGNAYAADAIANSYASDKHHLQQALPWWQMAAQGGNADAQLHLGEYLLDNGQDHQAVDWLRDAADRGDSRAHEELASLYAELPLTETDLYRGNNRFAALAERLDSAGVNSLFAVWRTLKSGSPLTQSPEALITRVQQGDPVAQYQLALHYRDGAWAVQRDPEKAMNWLQRAAAAGNPIARKDLAEHRNILESGNTDWQRQNHGGSV